jgi:5-deoxy-glucuronate isomerase
VSSLVVRHRSKPSPNGLLLSVTPESARWSYVGFDVYRLSAGMRVERAVDGQEVCAVMLRGRADISFGDHHWTDVGSRESVFGGPPDAVYAPPGGVIAITGSSELCEVALCWAPAKQGVEAKRLPAALVKPIKRGSGRTERTIHDILMLAEPAESLLVTEVLTPGGNWSSWPPRKHDTNDPPRESYLEETYYHRTARPEGFAVQTVYTDDRSLDEAFQVRDGDLVVVPRGYHSVAAGPGYDLYYLNVMAGPHRRWLATTDANHLTTPDQETQKGPPAKAGVSK